MLTNSGFDKKTMMIAKKLSLQNLTQNPNYTFDDQSIQINTLHNNGLQNYDGSNYEYNDGDWLDNTHINSCFFISIEQGLKKYGVDNFFGNKINVSLLKILAEYFDDNIINMHSMIDTINPKHKSSIDNLMKHFPDFELHIFIGKYNKDNNTWYTTPMPLQVIPNDKKINRKVIRIINQNMIHFELITSDDILFISPNCDLTRSVLIEQNKLLNNTDNILIRSDYMTNYENYDINIDKTSNEYKNYVNQVCNYINQYNIMHDKYMEQKFNQYMDAIKITKFNKNNTIEQLYKLNAVLNEKLKVRDDLITQINNIKETIDNNNNQIIHIIQTRDLSLNEQQHFDKIHDTYMIVLNKLNKDLEKIDDELCSIYN